MKSILLNTLCFVFSFFNGLGAYAQANIQIFNNAGFKIKCKCRLSVNSHFIQAAKQQGQNNIVSAYICAENEDNPDLGSVTNINIYDESNSYVKISPSSYAYFEKEYLKSYANNLTSDGFSNRYILYKGVNALEYTFDQMGLPTKAIMFLKNKKSYLIQVGSRKDLVLKFNSLKNSFEFL
jgi:hypothetical protein